MVRISFAAGWLAAGGELPAPQKIFEIVRSAEEPEDIIETDIKPPKD